MSKKSVEELEQEIETLHVLYEEMQAVAIGKTAGQVAIVLRLMEMEFAAQYPGIIESADEAVGKLQEYGVIALGVNKQHEQAN